MGWGAAPSSHYLQSIGLCRRRWKMEETVRQRQPIDIIRMRACSIGSARPSAEESRGTMRRVMPLTMFLAMAMPRPSATFHHAPPLRRRIIPTTRNNMGSNARGVGSRLYSATLDAESVDELSLPQSTATSDAYSATQITVLEGLDPVRKRCVAPDHAKDAASR